MELGGTVHRTITPPTGDSEVVPTSELGTQHVDNVSGFADLADRGGLGAWFAEIGNLNFIQIQGLGPPLNIDLVGTFHDVYLWIINNVPGGDTVANQFFVNDTTMLGLFSRESDALQELQFVLSGEAFPVVTQHQYLYVDATHGGAGSNIRRITAYSPGQFLRDDDFHWNAQADTTFVGAAIGAHAAQANVHHTPGGGLDAMLRLRPRSRPTPMPNVHHVPPAGGGGLDQAAVDALIGTHAGMPNVHHVPGAGGIVIATTDPLPVGETAVPGVIGQVVDAGHAHKLPTDNTLKFNASDELAVNVTDVIDRLNETVEYYSDETGNEYDDGGHASMGEDYDTSAHRHIIHKVQIDINGADTSNGFWRAGVFSIDAGGDITAVLGRSGTEGIDVDQRHTFVFPNPVEVPASQRIRILGSRVDNDGESGSGTRSAHLSRGNEESASPRESYDDAHLDFARIRHVRVNHAFPDVGDSTHDHDAASVRGDIKIWFTTKIDHGNLVGDGSVNAAHLDSGSAPAGECRNSGRVRQCDLCGSGRCAEC